MYFTAPQSAAQGTRKSPRIQKSPPYSDGSNTAFEMIFPGEFPIQLAYDNGESRYVETQIYNAFRQSTNKSSWDPTVNCYMVRPY